MYSIETFFINIPKTNKYIKLKFYIFNSYSAINFNVETTK